jgi:TonB family protein
MTTKARSVVALGALLVVLGWTQGLVAGETVGDSEKLKVEGRLNGKDVFRFVTDGAISEPEKIEGPNPSYPEDARRAGVQGVVVLETVIDESGRVAEVEVLKGAPLGLTEAAAEAVRQWLFKPAVLEGQPVAVRYVLTVKFRLDGGSDEDTQIGINFADKDHGYDEIKSVCRLISDRVFDEIPDQVALTELSYRHGQLLLVGRANDEAAVQLMVSRLESSGSYEGVRTAMLKTLEEKDGVMFRIECTLLGSSL